eukprot:352961_1
MRVYHVVIVCLVVLLFFVQLYLITAFDANTAPNITAFDANTAPNITAFDANTAPTRRLSLTHRTNQVQFVPFGPFIGIPNFYTKPGRHDIPYNADLITVCAPCSINLLHQAQILTTRYKSGPISLSVYIDDDIHSHTIDSQVYLNDLFDTHFQDVVTSYDIHIGIIYLNKSSPFWLSKHFTSESPMQYKIPINGLRNLAEYQVETRWLMNVDIDFEYFSRKMHYDVQSTLIRMHEYPAHTMFVVATFQINTSTVEEHPQINYNELTKSDLIGLIPEQILPFYFGDDEPYQSCTNYKMWFQKKQDYVLNHTHCDGRYEPFIIMNSNLSREYHWDNYFMGRHLDKTQRILFLRYCDFTAVALHDLFMIHANRMHNSNVTKAQDLNHYVKALRLIEHKPYLFGWNAWPWVQDDKSAWPWDPTPFD